eukprot:scaffold110613_cov69-Phaeocystis_antarctica.AAC.1
MACAWRVHGPAPPPGAPQRAGWPPARGMRSTGAGRLARESGGARHAARPPTLRGETRRAGGSPAR